MQLLKLLAILLTLLASQSTEAARLKILLQERKSFDYFTEHSSRLRRSTLCEKSCIHSSSCQCAGHQEKVNYTFPSYISSLADNSYVKVFQSLNVSTSVSTLLEYEIAGSDGLRARDVIDGLETNLNCKTLIFGGCIRDIMRGLHLDDINDIDFEVFCSSEKVFQHCEEHWGKSLCKLGRSMDWVTIGDADSKMAEQTTMDAVPLTIIFKGYFQNSNYLEFTANSLFYDHNGGIILDVSGTGMEDTCDCHVRIPVGADKEQWINNNVTFGYGLKHYRYFKLLIKGFTAVEETQNFIVMKVKANIATDELSFYLCHYVVMGDFNNSIHECIDVDPALCEDKLVSYEEQLRDQLGVEFYGGYVVSKLENAIPDCYNSTVPADKGVSIHSFPLLVILITMTVILVFFIV